MSHLERLIKAHTESTTIATISAATERIAEEIAREVLKDPEFRSEMRRLVKLHFTGTMNELASNGPRRRKKRLG